MSYSLALDATGDLRKIGSRLAVTSGVDKLKQDLDIWFRERYQIDRFHPTYGSTLDSHIGSFISVISIAQIKQEASRVISNYQRVQKTAFDKNPGKFSLDELVASINSIKVSQSLDSIFIEISLTTAIGRIAQIKVGTSL